MRVAVLFMMLSVSCIASGNEELPPLHHLVDVDVPDSMTIPEKFLLNKEGQITCTTCHGIKDIEEIPFDEIDKDDVDFFRDGPYEELTDFCYQCHDREESPRNNIHKLLDEQGELKEEQCEFCHMKTPDPESDYERQELKFRLPPQKICLGCHLKTPHINALNHLQEIEDEMLERLQKAEREFHIVFPLDGRKIICTTCHSAHEEGVLNESKPAARQVQDRSIEQGVGYEEHPWSAVVMEDKKARLEELAKDSGELFKIDYQRLRYEVLLRLPAKDGTLCLACHEFDR